MSIRAGRGKGARPNRIPLGIKRFSPDQAGKTETSPGKKHPERI
jgi:hypothetical protein